MVFLPQMNTERPSANPKPQIPNPKAAEPQPKRFLILIDLIRLRRMRERCHAGAIPQRIRATGVSPWCVWEAKESRVSISGRIKWKRKWKCKQLEG
jgi:hypothetical protein